MPFGGHVLAHRFMAGVDHGGICDACFSQTPPSFQHGSFLDIKGPDVTCFTHESREKERVVAIARRGVDHGIAGPDTVLHQQVSPAHGGGQSATGAGEFWGMHGV